MAAGLGMRLAPLTDRWPKPVLPIDGRPVIGSLMRELAASGFTEAIVVTGHLAEQVEELLGNGRRVRSEVAVREATEPRRLG